MKPAQALEPRIGLAGIEPRSGPGACRRRVDQGLDPLMPEAGAAIACHVAAHHTFAEARLERLIDDAAVIEIVNAAREKLVHRQLLGSVLCRIQHADHRSAVWTRE